MGRRVKLGVRCFVVRWLARAALAKTREYGDGTAQREVPSAQPRQ